MTYSQALYWIKYHGEKMAGRPLDIDPENAAAVELSACWLAREHQDGLDPNKGLLIVGNVGSGKTLLMRAIRAAMSDIWGVQFGIKPCAELVRDFSDCGYEAVQSWINAPHVCFDDIGTEGEAIHFGKRTMIMSEIIEARYDRQMRGLKAWTHLTTNMGAAELKTAYGERAYSRMIHLCNVLNLGASAGARDRRKTAPAMKFNDLPEPDSMYTRIHPAIAAKLREGLGPLVKQMTASTTDRKPITREEHIRDFAERCKQASIEDLTNTRAAILKANTATEGLPWVQAIDIEIGSRKNEAEDLSTKDQTSPAA